MSGHVPGVSSIEGTPYRLAPEPQEQQQQLQQGGDRSATPMAGTPGAATPLPQSEHGSAPASARSAATSSSSVGGKEQQGPAGDLAPGAVLRLLQLPVSQEAVGALLGRVEAVCKAGGRPGGLLLEPLPLVLHMRSPAAQCQAQLMHLPPPAMLHDLPEWTATGCRTAFCRRLPAPAGQPLRPAQGPAAPGGTGGSSHCSLAFRRGSQRGQACCGICSALPAARRRGPASRGGRRRAGRR
jgi:hypothetical protein